MANFLTNLNLNNNEIQNVVLQNLAVAPVNPKEGQVYFNTVEQRAKVYENGEWRNLTAEEAKSWTAEIEQAKNEAVQHADAKKGEAVQESKTYTDEQIKAFKPAEVNYNEKLAEVLRAQDPTINGLVKTIATLSEDEKRQIVEPVKTELTQKITEVKDELLGGASEDLDTLKELGEAVKKAGDITEAVKDLPKKEKYVLSNEPSGEHTVTHTRNTEDVIVQVFDTNNEQVITDVKVIDATTVKIIATPTIDITGYKVIVIG